jgi:tRNA dimethylallyltransferase
VTAPAAEGQPVLVIGGPTASGKSGLALKIALTRGGVVINADSMQVYEGLPLLTAQPSPEDAALAPHRLYACLQPQAPCSAAIWRDLALQEIEKTLGEGRLPVVTGGTGFYLKALIEGLSPIPDVPHETRAKAAALQKELGNPGFHAALARRDPAMAGRLHPFNTQRLVRAWEVLEATGKSLAAWQEQGRVKPPAHLRFILATLLPERKQLYRHCDERFGQMLKNGALEEARRFGDIVQPGWPLAKALGYPELASHLAGNISLTEAATLAQAATRHYAKRQVTWFRHQLKADIVLKEPDATALERQLGLK